MQSIAKKRNRRKGIDSMALTRKLLKSMGIESDQIDQIIEAHSETVDALKEERDSLKDNYSDYAEIKKKLDDAEKIIEESRKNDDYKEKYESIKDEFDKFKKDLEYKSDKEQKSKAFEKLLKEAGVLDKSIESVLKVSEKEIEGIEFDDDGKVKNADTLTENIKKNWEGFIQTSVVQGAQTATPPVNTTGTPDYENMSMEEYIKQRNQ